MSEPITWRMAKTHYRIKGSKCTNCGRPYFPPKAFCNKEGRRSRMEDIYFGDRIGRIYSGSVGRETTTKFNYLNKIFSVYVSFQEGPYEVRVAGRLTDYIPPYEEVKISDFIGREVVPRFRKVYDNGLIYYSRLQFSLLDDYYETHLTKGFEPVLKDQPRNGVGIVGYGVYILSLIHI